jgi:hypothetical protein
MVKLNIILEQVNGSVSILTFFFLCWCTHYLWDYLAYRKFSMRSVFVGLPPAIALAMVLYLENTGTLLTRTTVWFWRFTSSGEQPFTDTQMGFLLAGAFLTAVGLLLMIRLLSRPRFGEWPWVASAAVCWAYVLLSSIARAMV